MKIQSSINGKSVITTELHGIGHVGAHLICSKESDGSTHLKFNRKGIDMTDPSDTKSLDWGCVSVSEGDVIELTLGGDEREVSAPKITSITNTAKKLDISSEQADVVLAGFEDITKSLMSITSEVASELEGTAKSEMLYAVGDLMDKVYQNLARPTYRSHPSKIPIEHRDLPL